MNDVKEVVLRILQREGLVGDVGDGKGITYYGITESWAAHYNLPFPPKDSAEAAHSYEQWLNMTRLAEVIHHHLLLGDIVADYAIHSGTHPAITALQKALDVTPDGRIGPQTLAALAVTPPLPLCCAVLAARQEHIGRLLASPARSQWAKGWANRLASFIRLLAQEL